MQNITNHVFSSLDTLWSFAADAPPVGNESPWGNMLPMFLLMGFFFWFIVLRPQKKERQKREEMINSIVKGDRVVSIGGIHGKVVESDDKNQTVTIEICPKTTIKLSRQAVQTVTKKNATKTTDVK